MIFLRDGFEYTIAEARLILAKVAVKDKFMMPIGTFRWYKRRTNPLLDSQIRIEPGAKVIYSYQLAALILVIHCTRNGTFKQLQEAALYGEGGFPYEFAKSLAERYGVVFAETVRKYG